MFFWIGGENEDERMWTFEREYDCIPILNFLSSSFYAYIKEETHKVDIKNKNKREASLGPALNNCRTGKQLQDIYAWIYSVRLLESVLSPWTCNAGDHFKFHVNIWRSISISNSKGRYLNFVICRGGVRISHWESII